MCVINFQNYTLQKNERAWFRPLVMYQSTDPVVNLRRSPLVCLPVFLKWSPIHHPNVAEVMHHNYWLDNCVKIYVLMWLFSHIILATQSNSPLLIPNAIAKCDYFHASSQQYRVIALYCVEGETDVSCYIIRFN